MKKIFLVYGHYNDNSFNAAIRDTFIQTAELKGNKVDGNNYINSAINEADKKYGSIFTFINDKLEIKLREIDLLKVMLLE